MNEQRASSIGYPATFYATFPPWYQQKKAIDCS
jgi:hypothetical protein